jgi:hypothetical protein
LTAWAPQVFTLTAEIGWFEPYVRPPAPPPAPRSAEAEAPQIFIPPFFGWFEQFALPAAKSRMPLDALATALQFTVPTVTPSDLGWYTPYGKPPPPKYQPISAWGYGQPIAAVTTLTTDIGWFEPFNLPPAAPKVRLDSWSSFFGSRPDLGIGWFEPYGMPQRIAAAVPKTGAASLVVLPTIAPSIGWLESYARPSQRPQAIIQSVQFVTPGAAAQAFGWYFNFTLPPGRPRFACASWLFTPAPVEALTPVVVIPPGGTDKRKVALAKSLRAWRLRTERAAEKAYLEKKERETLEALAIRFEKEGYTIESLLADLPQLAIDDDEDVLELILLQM